MQSNTLSKFHDLYFFTIIITISFALILSIDYAFALEHNNSGSNMLVNANTTNNNFENNSETNETSYLSENNGGLLHSFMSNKNPQNIPFTSQDFFKRHPTQ